MANSWFVYNSGPVTNPTSYSKVAVAPPCPTPDERLCAIFANTQIINGVDRPIITPALQVEINNAINNLEESANVRLRPN